MTGRWRKLSGLMMITVSCAAAGCGAYGSSFVQGSRSDTPLETGVGQRFQKAVPPGTTVHNVRCSRAKSHSGQQVCKIMMVGGRPAAAYTYVVFAAHTAFHAYITGANSGGTWTPPAVFEGGY